MGTTYTLLHVASGKYLDVNNNKEDSIPEMKEYRHHRDQWWKVDSAKEAQTLPLLIEIKSDHHPNRKLCVQARKIKIKEKSGREMSPIWELFYVQDKGSDVRFVQFRHAQGGYLAFNGSHLELNPDSKAETTIWYQAASKDPPPERPLALPLSVRSVHHTRIMTYASGWYHWAKGTDPAKTSSQAGSSAEATQDRIALIKTVCTSTTKPEDVRVYDETQFTETAQFELHEGSTQTETLHFKSIQEHPLTVAVRPTGTDLLGAACSLVLTVKKKQKEKKEPGLREASGGEGSAVMGGCSGFRQVLLPVTNLSRKICTYKTGMCVHTGVEPMGNFEPREEPYELTYKPNPVPSGWHVRGAYKLVTEFICDEGLCCPKMTANMTIVKQK